MKRILYTLVTVAIFATSSCTNPEAAKEEEKRLQDSVLQAQQDSLLDMFKLELEAIQGKVSEVSASHGLFDMDTSEGQVLSKEVIITQVESLNDLLNANQKQLNDLYKRMRDSKVKNDELESMVKNMQERIGQRESQIDDLMRMLADKDVQIEQIIGRVDSMRVTNIELTQEIVTMDEDMHEVYYAIGESKELKEKGIITKEGGLLGLGATKKLDVSQLDETLFKKVDKRDLESVPLFSKKAKLITNHPEGSYAFKTDSEGKVESLEIKDKKRFWTATDYLVVEVSN